MVFVHSSVIAVHVAVLAVVRLRVGTAGLAGRAVVAAVQLLAVVG
jgi:hypothetical protein